jgi:hypothetical protein
MGSPFPSRSVPGPSDLWTFASKNKYQIENDSSRIERKR